MNAKKAEDYLSETSIFVTPVGSRLYGLANEHSDYDFLSVELPRLGRKLSKQTISGDADVRRVDFRTFWQAIHVKPGNLYLEALYSRKKVLGSHWEEFGELLESFRPSANLVRQTFHKTAVGTLYEDSYKRTRLGFYLASRWNALYWSGGESYDPQLTSEEREAVEKLAQEATTLGSMEERRELLDSQFFLAQHLARERYNLSI